MSGFGKAPVKAEGAIIEDRIESEIREGEFEWVEVLVPSHLAWHIHKMIELFLQSHTLEADLEADGVNDDN